MSRIKEIIIEPNKIYVGSIIKLKIKVTYTKKVKEINEMSVKEVNELLVKYLADSNYDNITSIIYEEIKNKKVGFLKKYKISELKGE